MKKLIVFLLLCLLGVAYAAQLVTSGMEAQTPEPLGVDLQSDKIKSLSKIERNEVLPLIIFENPDQSQMQYQMPEKLVKFELKNGKISNGTKFEAKRPGDQIFFCPQNQENSQNNCLVRQAFQESEPLQCASEPTPQWVTKSLEYGDDGDNIFKLVYKICGDNAHPFDPDNVSIYQISYNTKFHKTWFTDHEIRSPGLLNLNLLTRERNMDYPVLFSNHPIFIDHPISRDDFNEEATSSRKPSYQLQQMVPAEDMAFATWRKTTFNNLNYEWQHEKLISLWEEISHNIRSVVKNYIDSGKKRFFVNTAIVDIPNSSPQGDNQLSNIWVKMISVYSPTLNQLKTTHGTAILMNNFVDDRKPLDLRNLPLKKYCNENLCIDELSEKFFKIGSAIRCCLITSEILKIFNFDKKTSEIEEIPIPNVTISPDQEILSDPITPKKAAASLREIQPSEILPLISTFNRYEMDDFTTLSYPTRIIKIETKNRRIVDGSLFATNASTGNAFFCPPEDSDEKCLINKDFERYEPLQCAKEATPVVHETTGNGSLCGFDLGVIHNVGYELCHGSERHDMKLYEVCYDKDKNRSLFTFHGILAPRLLYSNLMLREREMEHFNMKTDEEIVPGYKLQKLVPSEDMPFGLWKKTTYQRINADWQHEKLIPLWNKINDRFRDYSFLHLINHEVKQNRPNKSLYKIHNHIHDDIEYYAFTGVFDIEYETEGPTEDAKSNIWVKMMKADATKRNIHEALVIFMNNFLIKNREFSTSPKAKENVITKYCEVSFCAEELEKEFEDIGGRIHCCPLSEDISLLFGKLLIGPENQVMSIPDISKVNVEDDVISEVEIM